jgi:hypothetical protein
MTRLAFIFIHDIATLLVVGSVFNAALSRLVGALI